MKLLRPTGAVLTSTCAPADATSAVLVLHGGSVDSTLAVGRFSLAALRLIPVARAIARSVTGSAVYRLRNSVRGWNGDGATVLGDAYWAVDRIAQAHPRLPVVIVGHSMGGRVAAYLARSAEKVGPDGRDDATGGIAGAVLLAPWLESADSTSGLSGVPLSVVQGTNDRTIPTRSTQAWLTRAGGARAQIRRAFVDGGEHAMLRHHRRWHRLCVEGVRWVLDSAPESAPRSDDACGRVAHDRST